MMAPIKKRTPIRARAATTKATPNAALNTRSRLPPTQSDSGLKKKDKRITKHNSLMSRVRDAGISKTQTRKRRRPSKKLEAAKDMSGMANALLESEGDDDEWEGFSGDDAEGVDEIRKRKRRRKVSGDGKMVMRSLKHRPGAMKRKRKMEGAEMERFRRNLAQMAGGAEGVPVDGGDGTADKWAALRSFIGGTMERDRAFGGG